MGLHPGSAGRSIRLVYFLFLSSVQLKRTASFGYFVNLNGLCAPIDLCVTYRGESTASIGLTTHIGASVHGSLERITLPAKDVVSVLPIPSSMHFFNILT